MKNILIADDIEIFRMALKSYLNNENHTILEASDGLQAIEIIKNTKLDLILCDVNMPNATGNEVFHFLKSNQLNKATPFIFLTAFLDSIYVNQNEVECISKPITKAQIKKIVEKYL
ncbi:MAG: response regulator [Cytophagales bacterium]|nr:MAG: response regulator [Cytophagales bacterium]